MKSAKVKKAPVKAKEQAAKPVKAQAKKKK